MPSRPPETPQFPPSPRHRNLVPLLWAIGAGAVALLVWLVFFFHPLPPRTLSLACGPDGSSYQVFGKRYQTQLAKQGVRLTLIATTGTEANLELLRNGKADAGFVDGGIAEETDEAGLLSLGTIAYEPLWFFTRHVATDRGLAALRGKRVSVGPVGSESRALMQALLKRNAMDLTSFQLLTLTPEDSASELLAGHIDGVVLVNSYASPLVRQLVKTPGIDVASFSRADAYTALFPSLTKRIFPAGVADLDRDVPPRDVTLLATKTSLIVRGTLHPALQYMLLETIAQLHARSGIFQKAGEFPGAEAQEIPLSPEARHYYKSGRPFLQQYMPFWLAALVEQFLVLLIPVIGLTYPLVKSLMAIYGWGMQRRIFVLYGELHYLETQLDKAEGKSTPELKARLKDIEERAHRIKVPAKFVPMLYSLKDSLKGVRARIEA
jgi:TRAP-type uncharacterized transport system substrate-binding protein